MLKFAVFLIPPGNHLASGKQTPEHIITGSVKANRDSQKQLYKLYYSLSMCICMRYSNTPLEAEEIVSDSFLKIFTKLETFKPAYQNYEAFIVGRIKCIIIHTAIDDYRKYSKNFTIAIAEDGHSDLTDNSATPVDKMAFK